MAESKKKKIELTEEDAQQSMLEQHTPQIKEAGMVPWVFANDKTNPAPFGLLNMFYAGVLSNTIGIMVAKDSVTGDEVAVLVGIDKGDNGEPEVYPLASLLGAESAARFLPPDGQGGYIELGDKSDSDE